MCSSDLAARQEAQTLRAGLDEAEGLLEQRVQELEILTSAPSYRIAYALTALPRAIRRWRRA